MKKLILLLAVLGFVLIPPAGVYAQGNSSECTERSDAPECGVPVFEEICQHAKENTPNDLPAVCEEAAIDSPVFGPNGLIERIVTILSFVVGIASVFVMIIFGGLRMVTSSGDPNTVSSARQTIIFASVGLAIAIVARILVEFIINVLLN